MQCNQNLVLYHFQSFLEEVDQVGNKVQNWVIGYLDIVYFSFCLKWNLDHQKLQIQKVQIQRFLQILNLIQIFHILYFVKWKKKWIVQQVQEELMKWENIDLIIGVPNYLIWFYKVYNSKWVEWMKYLFYFLDNEDHYHRK